MRLNAPDRHFRHDHFTNRELSLLQFQRRVLAQAAEESVRSGRTVRLDA